MLDYLKEFFAWLKKQPVVGPILNILNSRKGMIAVFLTGVILRQLPELEKIHTELGVVVGALVTLVIIWLATSLGYAIEDSAQKGNQTVVPVAPTGNVVAGTVTTTTTTSPTVLAGEVESSDKFSPAG